MLLITCELSVAVCEMGITLVPTSRVYSSVGSKGLIR